LFNPAQYFGGIEITNFEDHALEQKLDHMFMEYLPTEMEEKSEYGEFFSFSSPLTFL